MNNFYSRCCDCDVDYRAVLNDGSQVLECPNCGLTTTHLEVASLSEQLTRDQSCRIARMEIEEEIRLRFHRQ